MGARRAAAGGVPRYGHGGEITAIDLFASLERLAGSTYMAFGDGVLVGVLGASVPAVRLAPGHRYTRGRHRAGRP